jgi:hypothetical protein
MKHPVNGRKRLDYPSLKKLLREPLSCMWCGVEGNLGEIHLHHINLNPRDNRLTNLSVVCRFCHKELHRRDGKSKGPRYYTEYRREPYKLIDPLRKWGGLNAEERFNKMHAEKGGVAKLKEMYEDRTISVAEIGLHFRITRERVRQIIIKLGWPARKHGFMTKKSYCRKTHEFRHKELARCIKESGMSIEEFAKKIGISRGLFYQYLGLNCPISASKAVRISDITGVSIENLLNPEKYYYQETPSR